MDPIGRDHRRKARRRKRRMERVLVDVPEGRYVIGSRFLDPGGECLRDLLAGDWLALNGLHARARASRATGAPYIEGAWDEWGSPAMN